MNVFEELEGNIFVKDMLGQFHTDLDQAENIEIKRDVDKKPKPPKSDPSPANNRVAKATLKTIDEILWDESGADPDISPKGQEASISTEPEDKMPQLPKEVSRLRSMTKDIFCRNARSKRAMGVSWDEAFRQAWRDVKEQELI